VRPGSVVYFQQMFLHSHCGRGSSPRPRSARRGLFIFRVKDTHLALQSARNSQIPRDDMVRAYLIGRGSRTNVLELVEFAALRARDDYPMTRVRRFLWNNSTTLGISNVCVLALSFGAFMRNERRPRLASASRCATKRQNAHNYAKTNY
jgi:hypothetical protein